MLIELRESMVFYRSFYEAINGLPDQAFVACVKAILEYGLNNQKPCSEGIEKTIYLLTKPQIDANNRRWENGSRGGRPKTNNNQSITKQIPKDNLDLTKHEPNVNVNVNVNDNENLKESKPEKKRFAPPTLENVIGYCQEKGISIDALRFMDYYTSNGWKVGKNSMKDWRAAVRNWSRQDAKKNVGNAPVKSKTNQFHNFKERDTDYNAMLQERMKQQFGGKSSE